MYDELVKALRHCQANTEGCDNCPYMHNDYCKDMLSDAADAIEKLMAEVESLQNRIEHQNATIDSLYKTIEKLTEKKEKGNE